MMTDTALYTAATVTPNFVQGYPNCTRKFGGADRDRTGDLMLAKHALSQLSYSPSVASSQLPVASEFLQPLAAVD